MTNVQLITTTEVAGILGITPRHVARKVENGSIKTVLKAPGPTGAFFFDRDYIERMAAEQSKPKAAGALAASGTEVD